MGVDLGGWRIVFTGCDPGHDDCSAGRFEATSPEGHVVHVEVRTTAQVERILARELGSPSLDARQREAVFSVAGRQLIEACLAEGGAVRPLLFLDSRLFRVPGAERRLLRESGLLPG